jgi:protein phosphatase
MGSTLTAVHISDGVMTIAQVGDSRAYMFRDGRLWLLTEDQTLVGLLQKRGMLTPEQAETHPAKHVILQALGQDKEVVPELRSATLQHDDYLLLCTDGLSSYVEQPTIEAILAADDDEYTHCQRLVDAANAAGGADNVTVLLVRLKMYGTPGTQEAML